MRNRATILGIICASTVFIAGQSYASFITNPVSVGSITINTSGLMPTEPPILGTTKISANADTELYQHSAEKNIGAKRQLNVISRAGWNARILVRFDLGLLPPGVTVQSCTLNMYLSEASNTGNRNHGAFRIVQHATDWGEGDHLFSTAALGESSWRWYAKSNEWDELGGDSASQATAIIPVGTANRVWKQWNLTPDCVTGDMLSWVIKDMQEDNPNYTIRTEYQSRESFYEDQQPYLEVTYQRSISS